MWGICVNGGLHRFLRLMENLKKAEIFTSGFNRSIDEKSRISIPTRYRTQLERAQKEYDAIFVFCLPHLKSIRVYTYDGWMEFAQPKIDAIPDAEKRLQFTAKIYALLDEQTIDSQGRIKIKKEFLKAVGIEKNVYISGIGRGFSIEAAKPETNPFELSGEEADFINNMLF